MWTAKQGRRVTADAGILWPIDIDWPERPNRFDGQIIPYNLYGPYYMVLTYRIKHTKLLLWLSERSFKPKSSSVLANSKTYCKLQSVTHFTWPKSKNLIRFPGIVITAISRWKAVKPHLIRIIRAIKDNLT